MTTTDKRRIENLVNWIGGTGAGLIIGKAAGDRGLLTIFGFVLLAVSLVSAITLSVCRPADENPNKP